MHVRFSSGFCSANGQHDMVLAPTPEVVAMQCRPHVSTLKLLCSAGILVLTTTAAFSAPPRLVHGNRPAQQYGVTLSRSQFTGNRLPTTGATVKSRLPTVPPDQYTSIDAPGAGTEPDQGTFAVFVDSSNGATGFYIDGNNNYHSYYRAADGTFSNFDVNGPESQTIAHWANEKGTIVGDYLDSDTGQYEGFLRKANGKIQTFDGVEGGSHYTVPVGINVKGATTGFYYGNGYGTDVHAFLRAKDGTLLQFDAPDAGSGSFQGTRPQDINVGGTIVGYYVDANDVDHGFVRGADGAITEFDVAAAGTGANQGTQGVGIDDKGWISGDYIDANNVDHGFLRDPGGAITTFDVADAGSGAFQGTEPIELNNHREATGWYLDATNVYHGFLRSRDGSIAEFDAPGAGIGAYLGTSGYDINKHGVVAGWDQDDNGVYHGFLRTP